MVMVMVIYSALEPSPVPHQSTYEGSTVASAPRSLSCGDRTTPSSGGRSAKPGYPSCIDRTCLLAGRCACTTRTSAHIFNDNGFTVFCLFLAYLYVQVASVTVMLPAVQKGFCFLARFWNWPNARISCESA